MTLSLKGKITALAGQVGTNSVYTASHNPNGYLVVTAVTSGTNVVIPQYSKILAGTNFASTGLVITLPKLTETPAHPITAASSSTISSNSITLTFTCTGYMNWVNGSTVVISGITPLTYNGSYAITGTTTNTAFTISKRLNGTDGSPGLEPASAFGTAVMTISDEVTGLYKTNLTSTISTQTNLTLTGPNLIPLNTTAMTVFTASGTVGDFTLFNSTSGLLEDMALPVGIPERITSLVPNTSIYGSTAFSGTSINKVIFWTLSQ